MNKDIITYKLNSIDAGQIMDGLQVRKSDWEKTRDWYDGTLEDPYFAIEECNGREEAENMVNVYTKILEQLEDQYCKQVGIKRNR